MNGFFQSRTELFASNVAAGRLRARAIELLLCLTLTFTGAWAQKPASDVVPPPSDMTVSTRLDRTAIYPGDQFHYMITVDHPADYEFVLDNLTKETVNMDPFQVMDVTSNLVLQKDDARKLFVDLTLASFGTGQNAAQIPQFTLYYFRRDNRLGGADQAEAESLTVPGQVIGMRSTLPPEPVGIRDAITVNSWNTNRWILPIVGWVCGAVLVIGSGWELMGYVKRMKTRKGPDRRKAMQTVRTRWTSGVPSDFTDPKTCQKFYDLSYQNLKEYMGYYLDTPTMGLTAEEVRTEMKRLGAKPDLTQKVVKVLETCETLRYTRDGVSANTEAARAVADDTRAILSAKVTD
jgi:hypothetical protein